MILTMRYEDERFIFCLLAKEDLHTVEETKLYSRSTTENNCAVSQFLECDWV